MVFLLLLFPRISHQKQYAVSKGRCYGKEKLKRDGCPALQQVKQFPYQHLPTISKMSGYPVLLCRIPSNSLGQLSISQMQTSIMRVKNQVFVSLAQKASERLHTHGCPAPANTQRSKVLPCLLCSEFLYILYALPNYDQIRILTSSSIKILLLFPLSKELPKIILESRWTLLSVPMKILFTMLYISRCDIISGTSHSPHLQ